jgi:hypothetical protein
VFQSLRDQTTDDKRMVQIDCTERHWLDGVEVRELAREHGVRLGAVYAWLKDVERDFGRELLRLYPEYGPGRGR